MYPNPASDYIRISSKTTDNGVVRVLDLKGQVLISQKVSGGAAKINTTSLANGVYMVEMAIGNAKTAKKITIMK